MSVRRETRRNPRNGRRRTIMIVDFNMVYPDGTKDRIRRVPAVGSKRLAIAPLFCSRGGGRSRSKSGSRMSKRTAQAIFTSWQQRLGFDRTCNFHMLRHSSGSGN